MSRGLQCKGRAIDSLVNLVRLLVVTACTPYTVGTGMAPHWFEQLVAIDDAQYRASMIAINGFLFDPS